MAQKKWDRSGGRRGFGEGCARWASGEGPARERPVPGALRLVDEEFPGAEPPVRMRVGRAADAFGADAGVNGAGKGGVLDHASRFAWIVG